MRIVAGRWRGRTIEAPQDRTTRPTADRVRQALFDVIAHSYGIEARRVLDAFAGTGALGLEALSRDAAHATFFERNDPALLLLRRNLASLGASGDVLRADATKPPEATIACDLLFLDPPYGEALLGASLPALEAAGWCSDDALVVAEMSARAPEEAPAGWRTIDARRYGAARIEFWQKV